MVVKKNINDESDSTPQLEQPSVEEAPDGILDPAAPSATVVVPVYAGKAAGDHITMYWEAETLEGSTQDDLPVNEAAKTRVAKFTVEAKYIKIDAGTQVKVYYTVQSVIGSQQSSKVLLINIADDDQGLHNVQPPAISGVTDDVLNLESVPAEGATATVPPYEPMQIDDIVFIEINEGDWEDSKDIKTEEEIDSPLVFTIPRDILKGYSGQTIILSTRVFRGTSRFDSPKSSVRVLEPIGPLPPVTVPLAPDGILDPKKVTETSVEVIVEPYEGIAKGDEIEFTWLNDNGDPPPYRDNKTAGSVPQKYTFNVPSAQVTQNINGRATLSYTVKRGSASPKLSDEMALWIGESFEAPAKLDLGQIKYILATEKLPPTIPENFYFVREAQFGEAPYIYNSDNPAIATVDNKGQVVAIGNGIVNISATDVHNQTYAYPLTVSGVCKLEFVSASASFAGANLACTEETLRVPTLEEMRRFWKLYTDGGSGPVAGYLGWLPYPFWTGTEMGGGTAYAYDLNGTSPSGEGNATGRDKADYLQVVGITP